MSFVQPATPTEISAIEFRRQLGEIMNRAYYGGEQFVVKRDNLPMVKIIPVLDPQEISREEFFAFLDELGKKMENADQDELNDAINEALAAIREEDRLANQ
jgi:prevent-host-death family protein